jgi:hypothetical protein
MTKENARLTANVILGLAGVAAAYVVLTTPPLRTRAADIMLRCAAFATSRS